MSFIRRDPGLLLLFLTGKIVYRTTKSILEFLIRLLILLTKTFYNVVSAFVDSINWLFIL